MDRNKRRHKCAGACDTCKRRKERCDGNQPCVRCTQRGVQAACQYQRHQRHTSPANKQSCYSTDSVARSAGYQGTSTQWRQPQIVNHPLTLATNNTLTTFAPEPAHFLYAGGKSIFIGDSADSANVALLRTTRSLVSASLGPCPFVDDLFRNKMEQCAPEGAATRYCARDSRPPMPTIDEVVYLIRYYTLATNGLLDLFDEDELLGDITSWLSCQSKDNHILSTIYYLAFAIGAQTCPEHKITLANRYFDYAHYLTTSFIMEDPSIITVQAYAMVTIFLLGASRRNAAFVYLGTAVRAAYAVGLHRSDMTTPLPQAETQMRERLWKVLRVLDLFLSAILGRPPGTAETRDTELDDDYSSVTDLCAIYERVLTASHAKRMSTADTVESISDHFRRWTKRSHQVLTAYQTNVNESTEDLRPGIRLLHIKEGYYCALILLTRPFFVDHVSRQIARRAQSRGDGQDNPDPESSDQVLVHACIHSATCNVDILKVLLVSKDNPSSLPFVVDTLFLSGLILGLGCFSDLHKTYALDRSLRTTLELLSLFPHDETAKSYLAILGLLLDASNTYVERQMNGNLIRDGYLVNVMFGQMDNVRTVGTSSTETVPQNDMDAINSAQAQPSTVQTPEAIFEDSHYAVVATSSLDQETGNLLRFFSTPNSAIADFENEFMDGTASSQTTLCFCSYEGNAALFSTISAPLLCSTETH